MEKFILFLTLITCLSYGGQYTVETWVGNGTAGDTYGNRVRMVDTSGNVSTLAGTGNAGYQNGADSVSRFNYPRGIVANDNLEMVSKLLIPN